MSSKWWILTAVACGTFMSTLDSSIVNIALPTLTKDLQTDLYLIKWVVIVYLLVITCLLLPFGRLSDQYGRKNIFQLGFIVFTAGSALCGISPSLNWLIASRALQGVGASMLMSNSPAIITAGFPANERGKALGTLAMVVSAGLVSGPSIGGFLVAHFGWRSIFLVNIPIGILGILLVNRFVAADAFRVAKAPFDWAGTFLQTILLLSLMVLVDPPSISVSGTDPVPVSRVVVGIFTLVFGALFLKVESDARAPLFDLSLLKIRTFWTANLASFFTFVAYSGLTVLMPFFLEEMLAFSPDKAGLYMTAIPLTIFVIAPISGRISDRLGSQELSFIGATICALALFLMGGLFGPGINPDMSRLKILLGLVSVGLAMGLFQSPNNNAIMSSVPPVKLGVASALIATIRNLGFVAGTGLSTGLFAYKQEMGASYVSALHFTFIVAGIVSVLAMIASLGKRRGPLTHAT